MVCILLVDTAPNVLKIVANTDMVEPYCVLATIFNTFGAVSTNRIQTIFKNLLDCK